MKTNNSIVWNSHWDMQDEWFWWVFRELWLGISRWHLLSSRLSTFGNAGSAHLDYPRDSDLMEAFHCNQTQTNRLGSVISALCGQSCILAGKFKKLVLHYCNIYCTRMGGRKNTSHLIKVCHQKLGDNNGQCCYQEKIKLACC